MIFQVMKGAQFKMHKKTFLKTVTCLKQILLASSLGEESNKVGFTQKRFS